MTWIRRQAKNIRPGDSIMMLGKKGITTVEVRTVEDDPEYNRVVVRTVEAVDRRKVHSFIRAQRFDIYREAAPKPKPLNEIEAWDEYRAGEHLSPAEFAAFKAGFAAGRKR